MGSFSQTRWREWGHRVGPVQAVRVGPVLVDIARHASIRSIVTMICIFDMQMLETIFDHIT
ncbi:hypothetical protein CIK65_18065 [Brevibacterium aurantiacum]|uniref:Uncharacterized protein n=1 Tax=Brevibacterium aurantiacum TaxID=273384 RepID=A0A2A3YPY0_BREAU|nr:hypothetical protein CIK65_18065 [Brevibacterium aurantiacum]